MKKVFLSIAAVSLLSVACGDGRDIDSENAKDVVDQTTESTMEYATVDENSKVLFTAAHFGGAAPRDGYFKLSAGTGKVTDGKLTNGSFTLDISTLTITSLDSTNGKGNLEGHLKGADFFNDSLYPTALFEVTGVNAQEGEYNHSITGNLKLKDSTRSVTFNANVISDENSVSVKSEKFNIDRTQWGMYYGSQTKLEGLAQDKIISDEVSITIDITLTK